MNPAATNFQVLVMPRNLSCNTLNSELDKIYRIIIEFSVGNIEAKIYA